MDKFEFAECVSKIDEKFIEEAQPPEENQINIRRHRMPWALIAACLFLVTAIPILLLNLKSNETQTTPVTENIVPVQTQLTFSVYQNGAEEGESQPISGHQLESIETQTPDPALPPFDLYTYSYNWKYSRDGQRRYSYRDADEHFSTSQICCYENDTLLWESEILDYSITNLLVLENSILVTGIYDYIGDTGTQSNHYIQLFDLNGQPLWEKTQFPDYTEDLAAIEHENGEYSFFLVEVDYIGDGYQSNLCLYRYSANGELLSKRTTAEIAAHRVLDAVQTNDGFIVLLDTSYTEDYIGTGYVAFLSEDGTVRNYWKYENDADNMRFTNVLQNGNKLYLSGYLVHDEKEPHLGSELDALAYETLNQIEGSESEYTQKVTEHVRAYYTAILLEIDVASGKIVTFYTTDGATGAEVYLEKDGSLCWQQENIGSTYYIIGNQSIRAATERINYRLKDGCFTVEETQIYTDFARFCY